MSEQELREGLRAAVVGEPSLNFDVDALLARAKREIKRRRALVGAGTATAAVAVAAVAVPTLLGVPRGGGSSAGYGAGSPPGYECADATVPLPPSDLGDIPFSGPPSVPDTMTVPVPVPVPSGRPTAVPDLPPSLTVPPSDYPPAGPNVPPEPTGTPCQLSGTPTPPPSAPVPPTSTMPTPPVPMADIREHATVMRKHLTEVFPQVVPGATKVAVDEFGGAVPGAIADGQDRLKTVVRFTLKEARSAVGIAMFAPGAGPTPEQRCADVHECAVSEGPDGTKIVVTTDQAKVTSVSNHRVDGSVVLTTGAVTVAQLTALATDPALGL